MMKYRHSALLPLALFALLLAGCAVPPPASEPSVESATVAAAPAASAPEPAASAPAEAASAPMAAASEPAGEAETGPAVGQPVDPLQPEAVVPPDDAVAQTDLWMRVRAGFALPDLDDDYVRRQEQWYASRPDYVQRMTERSGRFLFHIVEEVEKRGMPAELALLPFIESAFNPQAMSVAQASGMWQFIPSTGKNFSLKQNLFRDDRRSVLDSTRAALDYLERLHTMFGDWHLALAAYNWGEGNVQRAIARNQRAGLPTNYASLRMPPETRNYVPKLQAVKNIVAHPEAFSLELPTLKNHPYFLSVPIQRDIDVELAARLAEVPSDEFKQLNPQMNKPVILAAGTPQVLLPFDNANAFVRNLEQHRGPLASWTAWVAPKTLKPADAAKRVGVSEAQLREVNHIPPRMLVKAGSTLLVPRGQHALADVSEHVADNAMIALAPDSPLLKRVSFKASKHGDSVAAVAKRYRVSSAQVAQWNKVAANASFNPGQSVVVFVAAAKPKSAVRTARAVRHHAAKTVRSVRSVAQR
jgi:membrane-bound lytic murein transglycosylase D